jgi:hypothetical protein
VQRNILLYVIKFVSDLFLIGWFLFDKFVSGRHDIAEILLKVALNTKNQIKSNQRKDRR